MKILEGSHIRRTYGTGKTSFDALKDVSLTIDKGETVAIVGKSGSGKSSLMHILALLDNQTSGNLTILGKDTKKLKESELVQLRNQSFGFIFQQFFMNPKDTVLQNVLLPLKVGGVPAKIRNEKAEQALASVGLKDKLKNKANDLSGGQKQRVCIARALVNDPAIIFADEPTGNLDSATGEKIESLLFQLNREKGITLIIVTHDLDLAARCDRQIYVKDGLILEEK
ncbi:ABC transporter ATP-binding protein [Enterococcus sp. AZ103]|uniref:ABC transporter ATP-binding protein n=1 Tax=Enterococcus sp. AZ103 TaxID=2774628 RepID=UPI003F291CD1